MMPKRNGIHIGAIVVGCAMSTMALFDGLFAVFEGRMVVPAAGLSLVAFMALALLWPKSTGVA